MDFLAGPQHKSPRRFWLLYPRSTEALGLASSITAFLPTSPGTTSPGLTSPELQTKAFKVPPERPAQLSLQAPRSHLPETESLLSRLLSPLAALQAKLLPQPQLSGTRGPAASMS